MTQGPIGVADVAPRNMTEAEGIALALKMCPPGKAIELHAEFCECIPCTCIPRVIHKPLQQA